ncbi:MAG TPA: hypothetical protein PLB18_09105, partial [Acidobacteriota bacterium]|nr:hypothetical protein [Acidobacteriota bacterium]
MAEIWVVGPDEINSIQGNIIQLNYFGTNKSGTKRIDYKSNPPGPAFVPATYVLSDSGSGGNIIENNVFAGQEGGAIGRINALG